MADVDTFRELVTSDLQAELAARYRVYDEDVRLSPEAADAWKAEGGRLARRLGDELGSAYEVSVSPLLERPTCRSGVRRA